MAQYQCYQYICHHYPTCRWAAGRCCSFEYNDEIQELTEKDCSKENRFAFYEDDGRVRFQRR